MINDGTLRRAIGTAWCVLPREASEVDAVDSRRCLLGRQFHGRREA
jgi:hypothetical protein